MHSNAAYGRENKSYWSETRTIILYLHPIKIFVTEIINRF